MICVKLISNCINIIFMLLHGIICILIIEIIQHFLFLQLFLLIIIYCCVKSDDAIVAVDIGGADVVRILVFARSLTLCCHVNFRFAPIHPRSFFLVYKSTLTLDLTAFPLSFPFVGQNGSQMHIQERPPQRF